MVAPASEPGCHGEGCDIRHNSQKSFPAPRKLRCFCRNDQASGAGLDTIAWPSLVSCDSETANETLWKRNIGLANKEEEEEQDAQCRTSGYHRQTSGMTTRRKKGELGLPLGRV